VTQQEREYTEILKSLYPNREGKRLGEERQLGGLGIYIGAPSVPGSASMSTDDQALFLPKLICQASLVVIGTPKLKISHLSADETFVFSSYDFETKEVLKNNSEAPIDKGAVVNIARPGGFIKIDDQLIRFDDARYQSLHPGEEYLLFLKHAPRANGYVVAAPEGDFVLTADGYESLSALPVPNSLRKGTNSHALTTDIGRSVGQKCGERNAP
jgi:hypothetical protein